MAETLNFAAVDLGAESGRVMLARFADAALQVEEIHRFNNVPVPVGETLHWDVLRLWGDITQGLTAAQAAGPLAGIGVDTWGLDFALLDRAGGLLGNPVHYRDHRTDGLVAEAFKIVPPADIFAQTGIQFMQINSLYQLLALARQNSPLLAHAARLLTIPDLFNYWLSGAQTNEYSNATTTQCLNPRTGDWAWDLIERLGLPARIFGGPIIQPGTVLGPARPELGLGPTPIIAPATHDTGSAVAAVPFGAEPAIYLSSGTWSLMGVEVAAPVINEQSLAYNFTNEGGVGGTTRLLKNIMGLWLVQECRRNWAAQGQSYEYAELIALAEAAPAFGSVVVPSDARFLALGDMPARLRGYCAESGQPVPETPGAVIRCALESLALEYRWVAERLDELVGHTRESRKGIAYASAGRHGVIHIIGGGARNALLNQFTADATGRLVLAGPVEATALGNGLVQALAAGRLGSLAEGRALIRASFPLETFEPRADERWQAAYATYIKLRG